MASVYVLREAESDEIRYVGVTRLPLRKRLSNHVVAANAGRSGDRCDWLRGIEKRPSIELVARVRDRHARAAEKFAIALMRAAGHRLVNETPEQLRAKVSSAKKGRPNGLLGRVRSDETRARIRAAKLVYWARMRSGGR